MDSGHTAMRANEVVARLQILIQATKLSACLPGPHTSCQEAVWHTKSNSLALNVFYKVSGTNEIVGSFIITYTLTTVNVPTLVFRMGMSEDCCLVTLV